MASLYRGVRRTVFPAMRVVAHALRRAENTEARSRPNPIINNPVHKHIMKYLVSLALALAVAGATPVTPVTPVKHVYPQGIDVSSYQPNVNWATVKKNDIAFAYIKATEGTCQ
ncbi:glycoside hydrolase family 25 protein [Paxillus involutus ATCC 200175]|uniref:Glycoside hydrolase family 25 protein n=1 Tax=Paxillus involutus ATCC 200175 TaxID=664439 RepID=A0A0C9TUQ1_PAXIN|nr:glycoside hydrolase family 25 protein [Paxillus involutus ATCC 200175]